MLAGLSVDSQQQFSNLENDTACFEVVVLGNKSVIVLTYVITFSLQYSTDSFDNELYTTTIYGMSQHKQSTPDTTNSN